MFYRALFFSIGIISLAGAQLSCARSRKPAVERLAVLPFENLTADVSLNWLGPAAATVIVYDLAGGPGVFAQSVETVQNAYATQANRVVHGYFFERAGRLEVRADIEDLGNRRNVASLSLTGAASDGVLPLANEIAKHFSSSARPFSTKNAAAFREYGGARSATEIGLVLRGLQSATTADPQFQAAYLDWARLAAASGDRTHALQIIDEARSNKPDAIDRARLNQLAATLGGTPSDKMIALEQVAKLTPADARVWKELAEAQVAQRKFSQAIQSYRNAGRLSEEDPVLWNEMGYAYAFARDRDGAMTALDHYQQLLGPNETNALDSHGETSFYLGDFGAAEKYFLEAYRKNPQEAADAPLKAAQARLMAGDKPGADRLFADYMKANPASVFRQAQWDYLQGRHDQAIARLQKLGNWAALNQLAIWKVQMKDPEAAALAEQAEAAAPGPREKALSSMARVLAARGSVLTGSASVDAYALIMGEKFDQAAKLLEKLYQDTNPSFDGEVRTLLAWAYLQTGRTADAAKLTELYPIPLVANDGFFAALIFPRFLEVRAASRRH